jgi:hypothetical protein
MARFLIEVAHEEEVIACAKAVRILLATGSHFFTNADFGCYDGEHKGWIIVDLDSREEARSILPPDLRPLAKITQLTKFSIAEIDDIIEHHRESPVVSSSEKNLI